MAGLNNNNNPFQSQVRLGVQSIQLVPGPPGPPGPAGGTPPTGIGFWLNVVAGTLFGAASIGTDGQIPVTLTSASGIVWTSLSGDVSLSAFVPGQAQVVAINGATVPAAGALTAGNVLQVSALSALTYAPVNLAGGANYVGGLLPAANQAAQVMGGDVTGLTSAAVVAGIQTKPVPAPSGTATLLTWNSGGSGLFSWATSAGSITFGGDLTGTSTVQRVQSLAGPAGAGGNIPIGDGTNNSGLVSLTSLQATPPSVTYQGSTGFSAAASAGSTGGLILVAGGTGGAGQGTNKAGAIGGGAFLRGGPGGASTGTAANANGGDVSIYGGDAGTGGSGAAGVTGNLFLQSGFGGTKAFVTANASGPGFGIGTTPGTDPTITRGTGVPATTQPNGSLFLRTDGTSSTALYAREAGAWAVVAGGGSVTWAADLAGSTGTNQWVAGISGNGGAGGTIPVAAGALSWGASFSAAGLSQSTQANGSNPNAMTLAPQGPGAGASSTPTGTPGNLVVNLAAPVSTGAQAFLSLQQAGVEQVRLTPFVPTVGGVGIYASQQISLNSTTAGIQFLAAGNIFLNTAGNVVVRDGSFSTWLTFVATSSAALQFAQGVTAPSISHAQQANGANPANLTIAPQAPGAGAATTAHGTPASLVVNLSAPVSTGADAGLQVQRNGVTYAQMGPYLNAPSQAALYLGNGVAPSVAFNDNHVIQVVGSANSYSDTIFNSPTAGSTLHLRVGGASAGFVLNANGVQFASETFSLGSGVGVIGIANRTTAPTVNPTGGAILYAQAGGLWIRESGGNNFQISAGSISLPLTASNGGTGLTTLTAHALLIGAGTGNVQFVGPGTAGTMLQAAGASSNPAFTAWTMASPGTAGHYLKSDGTNWTSNTVQGSAAAVNYGSIGSTGLTGISTTTVLTVTCTTTAANQTTNVVMTGSMATTSTPTSYDISLVIDGSVVRTRTVTVTVLNGFGDFALTYSLTVATAAAHTFAMSVTLSGAGNTANVTGEILVVAYNN